MKKFDLKFIRYSITLFVVSVILISVGTVSLTRSSERTEQMKVSANNRIENLGNENISLKNEVKKLKSENDSISAKLKKSQENEKMLNLIFEAAILIENEDFEKAFTCLEKVDKKLLNENAAKSYEKLYEIVKENTKND